MPPGKEDKAREFFSGILGMTEIPKPPELAKRGGCWFASGDVQIHLGVENDFRPAKKADPALGCADYEGLRSSSGRGGLTWWRIPIFRMSAGPIFSILSATVLS